MCSEHALFLLILYKTELYSVIFFKKNFLNLNFSDIPPLIDTLCKTWLTPKLKKEKKKKIKSRGPWAVPFTREAVPGNKET